MSRRSLLYFDIGLFVAEIVLIILYWMRGLVLGVACGIIAEIIVIWAIVLNVSSIRRYERATFRRK